MIINGLLFLISWVVKLRRCSLQATIYPAALCRLKSDQLMPCLPPITSRTNLSSSQTNLYVDGLVSDPLIFLQLSLGSNQALVVDAHHS